MQTHGFQAMDGVCGAYPRLRRMYPQRQLETQTIEARAFAHAEYRGDHERFEPSVEAGLSCSEHSSACGGKTPRILMDYCLRNPRLCTNGNVLQQFGSVRREVEFNKHAGARQTGRVALALRGTFPERLGALWTILQSELRHVRVRRALYDLSLPDLGDMHDIRVSDDRQYRDASGGGPDLATRIGTLVFFRLLQSLQRSRNKRGILKLIRQVPSMINDTPVLALFSQPDKCAPPEAEVPTDGSKRPLAGLAAGLRPEGVVEAVLSAAEELMLGEQELTSEEQGEVLAAMVGLVIKRGSLRSSLRVLRLLLFGSSSLDRPVALQGVGPYLKVRISCYRNHHEIFIFTSS